jgi:hypothetical protein
MNPNVFSGNCLYNSQEKNVIISKINVIGADKPIGYNISLEGFSRTWVNNFVICGTMVVPPHTAPKKPRKVYELVLVTTDPITERPDKKFVLKYLQYRNEHDLTYHWRILEEPV